MMKAANANAKMVMTSSVVTVSPETPLLSVLRLFVEEDIHGAPVVDDEGRALGVISSSDVLRAQMEDHDTAPNESDYLREDLEYSAPSGYRDTTDFQDRMTQRTASEVMTTGVISVAPEASVPEIARCLRQNRIHRVWVEEGGKLMGVVSALDLMPVIEGAPS